MPDRASCRPLPHGRPGDVLAGPFGSTAAAAGLTCRQDLRRLPAVHPLEENEWVTSPRCERSDLVRPIRSNVFIAALGDSRRVT
jgi:hypothetical protein